VPAKKNPLSPVKRAVAKKKVTRKKATVAKFPYLKVALWAFVLAVLCSPFYYGYVLKTAVTTWRWITDIGGNPNYRTYTSFQIKIPAQYKIHGIDVSYAQGKINWDKVSTMEEDSVRISFAFIKATEGLLTVDPYFKRNWREAPKAGITCGAYHYFRPKKDGLWQARFFLQNVEIEKGDLPPVADVETLDKLPPQVMRKELSKFLKHIEQKTKVRPIIYTGISFYNDYLKGYFDGYTLWVAHYNRDKLNLSEDTPWQFWQHSETAHINGVNHVVDFDAFKGDSLTFRSLLVP